MKTETAAGTGLDPIVIAGAHLIQKNTIPSG